MNLVAMVEWNLGCGMDGYGTVVVSHRAELGKIHLDSFYLHTLVGLLVEVGNNRVDSYVHCGVWDRNYKI